MVRLHGADAETVTLESTPDTRHRGRFGLSWPGGDAIVGDLVAEDGRTVTRRLVTHTLAWNADPQAYEDALIAFLASGPYPSRGRPGPL